jgi:hypothetical protein
MGDATAEELAEWVAAAPGPPMVTAYGVADKPVSAALLAWARQAGGPWMAGIAFLFSHWSRRALVTVWVPASAVKPHHGVDYNGVPRVQLPGPVDSWPALPPRYPQAGAEWIDAHLHLPHPPPDGRHRPPLP